MNLVPLIEFPELGDERGFLIALESLRQIPFDIKRIYYIYGTKEGISRGFNAHKALQQVAVCVSGRCRMVLDSGHEKRDIWLDSPSTGLFIDKMIWREMHDFSIDCVLLVIASAHYDESDYIRSYEEFIKMVDA
ncbi:MAG: FdtA/QdtA family cupin domain-containing protein [Halothiobacillus sp.]|jgi:UDP-2-acetamido-3-amino-2,3-dideoxy-glucuronate N-acetyltransferase|nr:FdtA/QdtA family cupin domain-containing protein [Halothiobacillus sp.]